jgi:predicted nucleic-acid-binding Zn-ribbon protein
MRERHICPKCDGRRILLVDMIPDTAGAALDNRPLNIAVDASKTWYGEHRLPVGRLTAAVCRQCGYTELYTADPGSIPVDNKYVREVVGPDPTPYR